MTSLEEHDFEDHLSVHNIKQNNESNSDFNFRQLQVSEVQNKLKTLDKRKTTEWDTISPKILNLTADGIVQLLTSLYNNCIKQGQWQKTWKMGEWVPVFKKEDRSERGNDRPITILIVID